MLKNNKGFIMIESILTLAVVTIIITGLFGLQLTIYQHEKELRTEVEVYRKAYEQARSDQGSTHFKGYTITIEPQKITATNVHKTIRLYPR